MENQKKFMKLSDVEAYRIAFHLSNYIWDVVRSWDSFARNSIGSQFANAADSISANIAEGWGRYGKRDKVKHYRISLGETTECLDWNQKSKVRTLLKNEEYDHIFTELKKLPKAIHS
ncbi:MAG: four helix bundle protein [Chitinophagales bacterium]